MRFVIRKPTRFIDIFRDARSYGVVYDDAEKLYELLPIVIKDLGFECRVLETNDEVRSYRRGPRDIVLAWHDYGEMPNTWYIKSGYLPTYFYFDKSGFSGWSELATEYQPEKITTEAQNETEVFAKRHIDKNLTRFISPCDDLTPPTPYVLVLDQRKDDIVSDLAFIDQLPERVNDAFAGTKYNVVVKPHPLEIRYGKTNWNFKLEKEAGSLHGLVASATAVYTINSSSGFEALLHNKKVFTAGLCDYHWVTTSLKSEDDVLSSVNCVEDPVDRSTVLTFLHHCITKYFMTTTNIESIKRKIMRAADEYQQNDDIPKEI